MAAPPPPLLHLVAGGDSPLALEVAKTRLAQGDDPNLREDEDGLTPLHVAAHWDNLAMVQLLLLHGADVWRADDHGRTPMGLATGQTREFLRRMVVKSEPERRTILDRMRHLHLGSRIGSALKGARKKMRRTLGAMLPSRRRRAESEINNAGVISTSTPRPSIVDAGVIAVDEGGGGSTVSSTKGRGRADTGGSTVSSSYCTADEGVTTMGSNRFSIAPGRSSAAGSGLLVLEWKIGWRKGLGEEGEKKRKDTKGDDKVTVRRKQRSPPRVQLAEVSEDESEFVEKEEEETPVKKQRTPRGLRKRVEEMSEERLRSELRAATGVVAGPIGRGGVRKGYEKKLIEALVASGDEQRMRSIIEGAAFTPRTPIAVAAAAAKKTTTPAASAAATKTPVRPGSDLRTAIAPSPQRDGVQGVKFSRPLELAIGGRSWQEGVAQALDESLRSVFINKGVSAFCYLLLDPRLLPVGREMTMADFIAAIFYVGKGTKARPHQHLIDARNARDGQSVRMTEKLARILSIWAAGDGVVSLQLSLDICDHEALTREAALIESLVVGNLSNEKGGTSYGLAAAWTGLQRAQLGTLMLQRQYRMLRADPSLVKPIRPEALPDALFKPRPKQPPTAASAAAAATAAGARHPPPPGVQNRLRPGR